MAGPGQLPARRAQAARGRQAHARGGALSGSAIVPGHPAAARDQPPDRRRRNLLSGDGFASRKTMRRSLLTLALISLLAPAAAHSSATQESMFQDDDMLEFSKAATVTDTLNTLATLGVDRVRV